MQRCFVRFELRFNRLDSLKTGIFLIFFSHALELKKQKEISEAAEKIRREKWIKEKTQEIKEMTVKGLEPDIQKLIAKHKAEIKKIKAMSQVSDNKIYSHVLTYKLICNLR